MHVLVLVSMLSHSRFSFRLRMPAGMVSFATLSAANRRLHTMSAASTTRLYVAFQNRVDGLYPPPEVLRRIDAGLIPPDALVCHEGAQAWTPLREMEGPLRAQLGAPPPLPPDTSIPPLPVATGYGAPSAPDTDAPRRYSPMRQDPEAAQVATKAPGDRRGLRFSLIIAALGLFFLPWLELRCQNMSLVSQTGLQTITGGVSIGSDLKEFAGAPGESEIPKGGKDSAPTAWLVFPAAIVLVITLFMTAGRNSVTTAVNAIIVIALLVLQCLNGFPVENEIKKQIAEREGVPRMAVPGGPDLDMEAMFLPKVKYTPWFYAELAALAAYAFASFKAGRGAAQPYGRGKAQW